MLGLVQLACGAAQGKFVVGMTDKPGYPTPADWSKYLGLKQYSLPLTIENEFRFGAEDIRKNTKLLMVNYPHNPTGQIATGNGGGESVRLARRMTFGFSTTILITSFPIKREVAL